MVKKQFTSYENQILLITYVHLLVTVQNYGMHIRDIPSHDVSHVKNDPFTILWYPKHIPVTVQNYGMHMRDIPSHDVSHVKNDPYTILWYPEHM